MGTWPSACTRARTYFDPRSGAGFSLPHRHRLKRVATRATLGAAPSHERATRRGAGPRRRSTAVNAEPVHLPPCGYPAHFKTVGPARSMVAYEAASGHGLHTHMLQHSPDHGGTPVSLDPASRSQQLAIPVCLAPAWTPPLPLAVRCAGLCKQSPRSFSAGCACVQQCTCPPLRADL